MGFLIVVLGRQQLFTENTLTVILPLLRFKNLETLLNVGRLWATVLVANLVGAFLFAVVVGNTNAFPVQVRSSFTDLGRLAIADGFWTLTLRGIFAGWLIALMVWLLPFAEVARVWVIIIITYVIGLGSFSHVIAGSIEAAYLAIVHERTWLEFSAGFVLPALIGNIIGGVALVAALGHAQIASESE
jgi:formate/nitrite transporter FocA (FNT family)